MKNQYTQAEVIDTAEMSAFLYAGALQHPTRGLVKGKGADFEHWGGHTSFVTWCAIYADLIGQWLDARCDSHPGVMLYEVIEPMGEWLIGLDEPLDAVEALERFKTEYLNWITPEDEDA
jgi:hypothetical protein